MKKMPRSINNEEKVVAYVDLAIVEHRSLPIYEVDAALRRTIGQVIDEMIVDTVNDGSEIQTLELSFSREQWHELATEIRK